MLRDSDIEIEEEAHDLVVMFESALKRRRQGRIIRLMFSGGTPQNGCAILSAARPARSPPMSPWWKGWWVCPTPAS